jgi:hypothetical protein
MQFFVMGVRHIGVVLSGVTHSSRFGNKIVLAFI